MVVNIHAREVKPEIRYKNISLIKCDYLKDLFEEIHYEMFKSYVFTAIHTLKEWQAFEEAFLDNEFVQEYDEAQYELILEAV